MKDEFINTANDSRLSQSQKDWIVRQRKNYITECRIDEEVSEKDIMKDSDWLNWDNWVTKIRHKIWDDAESYETQKDLSVDLDSTAYYRKFRGYYIYHVERGLIWFTDSLIEANEKVGNHNLAETVYNKDKFVKGFFASRNELTKDEFDERIEIYKSKLERLKELRPTYWLYHVERGFIGKAESREELNSMANNHTAAATINKTGQFNSGFFASTRELNETEIKDWISHYVETGHENERKELYIYNKDGFIEKTPSVSFAKKKYKTDFFYILRKKSPLKGFYCSFTPTDDETLKNVFSKHVRTREKPLYVYTREGLYKKYDSRKEAVNDLGHVVSISIEKKKAHKGFYCSYRELSDESVKQMFSN